MIERGSADLVNTTYEAPTQLRNHWESSTEKWKNEQRHPYWYITFDDARLGQYVEQCQRLLPADGFDMVPADGLHMTIAAADAVSDERSRPSGSSFESIVGPAIAIPSAIALSAGPSKPFSDLARSIGVQEFWPHVTIAYSNRDQPLTEDLKARLDAINRLDPCTTEISAVQLVNLYRTERQYKWDALQQVALG